MSSPGSRSAEVRLALVVTTYESPDALAAVLSTVARQSSPPDEVLIADDGSGAPTQAVIAEFLARSRVPSRAVRQQHEGFRLTRLRNLAIAATTADYIVFVDGDMLLHPEFIADHRAFARPGFFAQGVRVHADAALTARLLALPEIPPARTSGLGGLRRAYLLHSRGAALLMRTFANGFVAIKGCNQGFFRADLARVNGFNEAIQGWGPEDKELCARLGHAGVRRQTLLFGGIALHLHHPTAARDRLADNLSILETTRRERLVRCALGLDAHTS
jgi:glycosyltransferase involved in cell wall biosynthesis